METLTYFIEDSFIKTEATLGDCSHQHFEELIIKSMTYTNLILSGSLFKEVVFEDVVFENCTFFGSQLVNCLFLNCLFINCKFKFSRITDCNFESTTWENCMWGLSSLKDSEIDKSESIGSMAYESTGTGVHTKLFTLADFLHLSA
ncbi:MAG: hypothetical protein HOP07_08365 [Bacteriovoracaceae bacterium]|nr:hypothetical protein [Bacteriovoracaceae bacterium]